MERKRLISLVGGLCLTVIGTVGAKAQEVYITVENKSTGRRVSATGRYDGVS